MAKMIEDDPPKSFATLEGAAKVFTAEAATIAALKNKVSNLEQQLAEAQHIELGLRGQADMRERTIEMLRKEADAANGRTRTALRDLSIIAVIANSRTTDEAPIGMGVFPFRFSSPTG